MSQKELQRLVESMLRVDELSSLGYLPHKVPENNDKDVVDVNAIVDHEIEDKMDVDDRVEEAIRSIVRKMLEGGR